MKKTYFEIVQKKDEQIKLMNQKIKIKNNMIVIKISNILY